MTVIVRFAPSPTGYIHIGNTRPALFNWLFAKQRGGQFILRYDDTDVIRSKQEYADQIAVDLDWLGIKPDRVERQSERMAAYDAAAQKLKDAGLFILVTRPRKSWSVAAKSASHANFRPFMAARL